MIRLWSTDFDGTLVGLGAESSCCGTLAEALQAHRAGGGLWAVNTGRGLDHAIDGIERFGAPSQPDFLLTNEREIFRRTRRGGWEAHGEWNETCTRRHRDLFLRARELLRRIERLAAGHPGTRLFDENGEPVGLVTPDEHTMAHVAAAIVELSADLPEFSFQRNSVYLRFCHADYDKGSALAEVCRVEGLSVEEVFAIGDHFNDLPMLDPRCAGSVACPANAIPEVQRAVRNASGYVARAKYGEGVAEAIRETRRLRETTTAQR